MAQSPAQPMALSITMARRWLRLLLRSRLQGIGLRRGTDRPAAGRAQGVEFFSSQRALLIAIQQDADLTLPAGAQERRSRTQVAEPPLLPDTRPRVDRARAPSISRSSAAGVSSPSTRIRAAAHDPAEWSSGAGRRRETGLRAAVPAAGGQKRGTLADGQEQRGQGRR